jgi:phosphoribosylformimino-5-aminoimidazole carboxamide ribotide isomerase
MILYPAMDLMGGRVVRLAQGRFEDATIYPGEPAEALAAFAAAGAGWAHVVDLDGARAGAPVQHDLLYALGRTAPLKLQVAGGFRTEEHIARVLDAGVARVVIGSLAVKQPELVRGFLARFGGERITLSLDVRLVGNVPMVATLGWTEDSGRSLWDIAALYPEARHLLLEEAGQRLPNLAIQASGGVSSLDDLTRLGTAGAIVGKALWEGRIDLAEALRACA